MIDAFSGLSLAPQRISRPRFHLTAGDVPLPLELLRACMSVSVTLAANRPAAFSIAVNDPQMIWIGMQDGLLQEGRSIDIAVGYGFELKSIFSGAVIAVGADLSEGGGFVVQVQGFDALHKAARESRYEQFAENESDSAIIRKIAQDVLGLRNVSVQLQGTRSRRRFRKNTTALELLDELATEYGCRFWVESDTLFFRPERVGSDTIALRRRLDLISLSVRLSTAGQVEEVEARTWDSANKKQITATARASELFPATDTLSSAGIDQTRRGASGNSKRVLHAEIDATTQEEAQRYAEAELRRLRRNLLTADAEVIGNPAIRVGTVVALSPADVGRFHGEYIVDSARHDVDRNGYRTFLQMRRVP